MTSSNLYGMKFIRLAFSFLVVKKRNHLEFSNFIKNRTTPEKRTVKDKKYIYKKMKCFFSAGM
jgi:hypothetical protein